MLAKYEEMANDERECRREWLERWPFSILLRESDKLDFIEGRINLGVYQGVIVCDYATEH